MWASLHVLVYLCNEEHVRPAVQDANGVVSQTQAYSQTNTGLLLHRSCHAWGTQRGEGCEHTLEYNLQDPQFLSDSFSFFVCLNSSIIKAQ